MNEVYILLGSNIDPEKNILLALDYLNQNFSILDVSTTWQTKPVGSNADDFLNTAVKLLTSSDAHTLKQKCLCHIEQIMGRVRSEDKNAPRTIDIDIVIFNGKVLDPDLFKFDHMILPFSELIPDLGDATGNKTLAHLAKTVKKQTLCKEFKCLLPTN